LVPPATVGDGGMAGPSLRFDAAEKRLVRARAFGVGGG